MTNRANVFKVSEADLKREIKWAKDKMFERYFECPMCGNEPFPGAVILRGKIPVIPAGYFCPHCHAISLAIAIRVKAEHLHLFESTTDGGHQGDIQNRIDAQEEKEMTARQKMMSIIDPDRIYQKLRNTASAVKNRVKASWVKKGLVC